MSVEMRVREFLQKDLGKDLTSIGGDDSLLESGTIDSVGVTRLVSFLESTYRIQVDPDDLMPENFDTLSAIAAFVGRRQAASGG